MKDDNFQTQTQFTQKKSRPQSTKQSAQLAV